MIRTLLGPLLLASIVSTRPAVADGSPSPSERAWSVVNAFQVMCTLELPNFDFVDAKAAAMKMQLQSSESGPSANDTTTRSKAWAGGLTDGPFMLLIDEMSGTRGRATGCAVAAEVPDVDAFRAATVKAMKLPGVPAPESGSDGSRAYVWKDFFGPGTIVIERDFGPARKPGVMLKLLSMVGPAGK
jgi:hypothetical protein